MCIVQSRATLSSKWHTRICFSQCFKPYMIIIVRVASPRIPNHFRNFVSILLATNILYRMLLSRQRQNRKIISVLLVWHRKSHGIRRLIGGLLASAHTDSAARSGPNNVQLKRIVANRRMQLNWWQWWQWSRQWIWNNIDAVPSEFIVVLIKD